MSKQEYNKDLWKQLSSNIESERNKGFQLLITEMDGIIIQNLMQMGASREDAEDVLYEGLSVIYCNGRKKRFGPDDNIQGYLKRTCKFIWLKKTRDRKGSTADIDDLIDLIGEEDPIIPSLADKEMQKKLKYVLSKLKPKCQSILNLIYFEEQSPKEIMEQMNFSS